MKFLVPLSVLCFCLAAPGPAFANPDEDEPVEAPESRVRYQKVTEIDGDALELTGAVKGPRGDIISLRRSAQFRPLVQLREHFDVEMKDSANAIR